MVTDHWPIDFERPSARRRIVAKLLPLLTLKIRVLHKLDSSWQFRVPMIVNFIIWVRRMTQATNKGLYIVETFGKRCTKHEFPRGIGDAHSNPFLIPVDLII